MRSVALEDAALAAAGLLLHVDGVGSRARAAAAAFNAPVVQSESLQRCRDYQRRWLVRFVMLEAPTRAAACPTAAVARAKPAATLLQHSSTLTVAPSERC